MNRGRKVIKIASKFFLGITGLFILLFASLWLILKVPAVQNFLVSKATTYVSKKTHTRVELKYIDLAFPKSIILQGIFLEDQAHDTLLAVNELEVNINMLALLSNTVSIELVSLDNFHVRLRRNDHDSTFNYQFLVNAFSSDKTQTKKDTASETAWKIKADAISLTKGYFDMQDAVTGLNINFIAGNIEAQLDLLDLDNSIAKLGDIQLNDVHGTINSTKLSTLDTTSTSDSWNGIQLSQLTIEHSSFKYADVTTSMLIDLNIDQFKLEETFVDISKEKIVCEGLSLSNSTSIVQLKNSDPSTKPDTSNSPGWNITLAQLDLEKNAFKMDILNESKIKTGIDWNHLGLTSINASAENIIYNGPLMQANIASLSAQDKSGFGIRSLEGNMYMDATKASLTNLSLKTNYSQLGQNIKITYRSLEEIMSTMSLDCNMQNNQIAMRDLLLLVPSLDTIDIIHKNKNHTAAINLIAKGNIEHLDIKQFYAKILSSSIAAKGKLRFVTDPEKLFIDLNFNSIKTGSADIASLLPDSIIPASIHIPAELNAKGNYTGTLSDFISAIDMQSSIGSAFVHATIKDLQKEVPSYQLAIQTHSFNLGKLLDQSTLGILNGVAEVKGQGLDTATAIAQFNTDIESLGINTYMYHSIHLDGSIDKGLLEAKGNINDDNLKAALVAKANLNDKDEFYDAQLNLKGADLQALGLAKEHVTVSANTEVHLIGNPSENINGHISTRNILVIQNGKTYKEDSLILISLNEPGKSSVKMNSSMFAASFEGNIDIFSVKDALTNHLNRYFYLTGTKFQKTKPQNFAFEIKLNDSPILREVVFPALTEYQPMVINGAFNSEDAKLAINADIPSATYDGTSVKNFVFNVDSDNQKMTYNTGWSNFSIGTIDLQQTSANGKIQHDTTNINITIKNTDDKDKLNLSSIITLAQGGHYRFSILKDGLALQEKKWDVAEKNYIEIGNKYIFADHFNLSHNNQFIKLQSAAEGEDLDLQFNSFNLHTISQALEDDTLLVQGILDGEINLKNIQHNPAFTSKLNIRDLAYKNSRIGNLKITADNLTADRYTASVELADSTNRAIISGYYLSSDEKSALNFNANIQSIHLNALEAFSGGQLSASIGKIKGAIAITGSLKEPVFNGNIQFVNASSKIAFLNQRLFMKKESITIDSEKITFNSFNILDSLNNEAIINGNVGIKEFNNLTFNMDIQTKNFMVLNTTNVNNKLYYGKVILDSKISVKGNQDLPIINADIHIVRGSSFTFAVPDSKVSLDRGDGIVIFTSDSSSLDPIMLRQNEAIEPQKITGVNLSAKIHINRNSTLKLLVDPISGDSLSVRGDADLNFKMDASGQTSLAGTYVVYDGSYKASLENVFVRKFNISKGSTIIWSGDPFNALIDITATYTTKTSPDGLLANSAVIDSSALRKPLPFIIVMSMQGQLLKPSISFQLDMPDNSKGAMGGEVYSKISEINANESEVNKQVFALLALNKFITPDNSGSGGASDFARRSVSRMMSNELNKLSAKYVEGLQIDVDVQSYNGVNNGQQQGNTQVEVGVTKNLLNERLSVQIGGNVPIEGQDAATNNNTQNITGDVKIEYKLTKNGRYKVSTFRTNQYDGIINGTIVETGVGFMYVRDFTHFKELIISEKKRKKLRHEEQ